MKDTIYREAAIDALWKALYEYEEKTEKQFRESDDLDVADWIQHRIFVQNMSDIDRQVIMELPSAQPEPKWIPVTEQLPEIKEHHISEACIVYCKHSKHGYTVGFAELEENIFGQVGWNCERDDEYHEALGTVLAWMPLPEPYQEGE